MIIFLIPENKYWYVKGLNVSFVLVVYVSVNIDPNFNSYIIVKVQIYYEHRNVR